MYDRIRWQQAWAEGFPSPLRHLSSTLPWNHDEPFGEEWDLFEQAWVRVPYITDAVVLSGTFPWLVRVTTKLVLRVESIPPIPHITSMVTYVPITHGPWPAVETLTSRAKGMFTTEFFPQVRTLLVDDGRPIFSLSCFPALESMEVLSATVEVMNWSGPFSLHLLRGGRMRSHYFSTCPITSVHCTQSDVLWLSSLPHLHTVTLEVSDIGRKYVGFNFPQVHTLTLRTPAGKRNMATIGEWLKMFPNRHSLTITSSPP